MIHYSLVVVPFNKQLKNLTCSFVSCENDDMHVS